MKVVTSLFTVAVLLTIIAAGCGGGDDRPETRGSPEPVAEAALPPIPAPVPEPAEPEEDPAVRAAREAEIKAAIIKAERIEFGTKGKLKPSANNCLWGLNNEDPPQALEVAKCMNRAEVFNDLRACIEPCRPPDPSLSN